MTQIFFVQYFKYFWDLLLSAVELAEREAGHGGGVADGEGRQRPLVVRHGRGQVGVGHALPQVGLEPVTPVFAVFVSAELPRVPPRQLVEDPPVHLAALLVPAPHRGRGRGGGEGEGGHQQQQGGQHPHTGHGHTVTLSLFCHTVTPSHCHCHTAASPQLQSLASVDSHTRCRYRRQGGLFRCPSCCDSGAGSAVTQGTLVTRTQCDHNNSDPRGCRRTGCV